MTHQAQTSAGGGPSRTPRLCVLLFMVAVLVMAACSGDVVDDAASPATSQTGEANPNDDGPGGTDGDQSTDGETDSDDSAGDQGDHQTGASSDPASDPESDVGDTGEASDGHDGHTAADYDEYDGHGLPTSPAPPPSGAADRVLTAADQAELANGFVVPAGEIWEFDPDIDVTIQVRENVLVEGVLRMRPRSADVEHFLQFVDIDESAFVGSGMSVLESDVGIWVIGAGVLDLQGAERTGWTRLAGSASAGSRTLELDTVPVGWRAGDELSVAPTTSPTVSGFSTQFDEVTISSINGSEVTLSQPLRYDHPMVNGSWTAEVMNLTRNVRIEGQGQNQPTPAGRGHLIIISSNPQTIRHVQIRHFGARTDDDPRDPTALVLGRYSLHFHHSGNGSRGSVVEGVVVRNSGNSAYVPHASHGINFIDNIAYDGWENAFWWDQPAAQTNESQHDSHDIFVDRNIVALLQHDPPFRGFRLTAFTLATGLNLTIQNSVAIGVQGTADSSGFRWPENSNPQNIWEFSKGNIAHNNKIDGIFVWQNNNDLHEIKDFVAYHNGESGIDQGAYLNAYRYSDIDLFGNGRAALIQHAGSTPLKGADRSDYGLIFEGIRTDGILLLENQVLRSTKPALYLDCSFTGVRIVNDGSQNNPGVYDFVNCGLEPSDFVFDRVEPGTVIRVQDGDAAFQLDDQGALTSIAPFFTSL